MDPLPAFKRNYLLCPVCKKTWDCLSVHLRRVCMKTHDEDAIEAAVERAKAEMRVLLATGRVFKYGRLCQIVAAADPVSRLIEELESRFLVVTDVPPPLPTTIERSGPSSSRATQATGLEGEPSESSSVGSGRSNESSGETFQRFLTYQTIKTNLRHDDKDLHTDCREFIDYLGLLQKSCCKKVSKEITQKRHEILTAEAELTMHDCTAVLRAAKEDFLAISQKMLSEKEVTTDECLDYMYIHTGHTEAPPTTRRGVAHDCSRVAEQEENYNGINSSGCQGAQDECSTSSHVCPIPGGRYLV
ncbi:hypothetical protein AMELA_G00012180 [Ameiurus melas]|uniref:Uncharacterized protein n=1 Tax=Ameiurus melas TaxID=219545 RepID=A0A7J6BHI3_AMEME|nr:hypothetical protein AMELA_G00012180 [Ameiurus melas]